MNSDGRPIPQQVSETGLQQVHQRPYVAGDDKIIVGRRGMIDAWRDWHRLEINPPHAYAALLFDVDNPSVVGWAGKPKVPPSWIVQNTVNGHMHLGYALENPVGRHDAAGMKPQRYAAYVADRLSLYLGADPGYRGLIHRNPVNPGPNCIVWLSQLWLRTHTLHGLDQAIPKDVQPVDAPQTGIGRNVDLFTAMVKEVHRPRWADTLAKQGWREAWLDYVRKQNQVMFPGHELPDFECRSIARSCHRYWVKQYSPAQLSAIQTQRNGKRWHDNFGYDFYSRDASIASLAQIGFKQREIAEIVELSQGQVSRRLRNMHPITVIPPLAGGSSLKSGSQVYEVVNGGVLCDTSYLHRPGASTCIRCLS